MNAPPGSYDYISMLKNILGARSANGTAVSFDSPSTEADYCDLSDFESLIFSLDDSEMSSDSEMGGW